MASRIQISTSCLADFSLADLQRERQDDAFLSFFFFSFLTLVGVVCHSSLSFIIRRCHNRFRCHPAIIILIVIVFVVVASKEKTRYKRGSLLIFKRVEEAAQEGCLLIICTVP